MRNVLTLTGGGHTVALASWLDPTFFTPAGARVFGLPPVSLQWFEGAGDGGVYRGARTGLRDLELPIMTTGHSPDEVRALLSRLAVILDPRYAPARLRYGTETDVWWLDVVRTGGGDWIWGEESDASTWVTTVISLQAGDPYWTRELPESVTVRQSDIQYGLLSPYALAELRVSPGGAFGTNTVENSGDADAWPVWTIDGPATTITLVGAGGQTLSWAGTLSASERLIIDAKASTVVDGTGANRYADLGPAPRFWSIAPGTSEVVIAVSGGAAGTVVTAQWWPRRWLVF